MIGSDAAGLRRANGHRKPSGNEDGDQSSALKIPYDMYLFLHRIHAIQVLLPQTSKDFDLSDRLASMRLRPNCLLLKIRPDPRRVDCAVDDG